MRLSHEVDLSVPDLARAVVAPSYKFVPGLVERAVGQRQDVRSQDLEQVEVANLFTRNMHEHPCEPHTISVPGVGRCAAPSSPATPCETCLVGLKLLDQLVDEPPQLGLATLADERLPGDDVVHEHLDVRPGATAAKGPLSRWLNLAVHHHTLNPCRHFPPAIRSREL